MELKKKTRLQKIMAGFIAGLLVVVAIWLLYLIQVFDQLELMSYDLRFRLRGPERGDQSIALLTIDQKDKEFFRRNIKDWDRSLYAAVIRKLADAGVKLIAFDLDLSMPSDPAHDQDLADALGYSVRVVLGRSLNRPPLQAFRRNALGEGTFDLQPDRDGTVRSIFLAGTVVDENGELIPLGPLGFELAQLVLYPDEAPEIQLDVVKDQLSMNGRILPATIQVNYSGPPGSYPSYSFSDVYRDAVDRKSLEGKIVLIGNTDPLAHDYFSTPFPAPTRQAGTINTITLQEASITRMSGLEIHANVLDTILSGKHIRRFGRVPMTMVLLIPGCLLAFLFALIGRRPLFLVLLLISVGVSISLISYRLFVHRQLWLVTVPILVETLAIFMAVAIVQWRIDLREKNQIRNIFGKYVSQQVADMLSNNPEMISFRGKKARLTMFFSDIRGFTSMSETMDPQDISELLNEYFARMTKILFKYDGTLDKFMGDAIMAFFGNPQPYDNHAFRAVCMSLDMIEEVKKMNDYLRQKGNRTINVGIGINTGDVTVGNLGSEDYFDYTVIGDAVNLACRLEAIAKGGQIIVSDASFNEVKDLIEFVVLEPVKVKGKEKPIQIYEVTGLTEKGRESLNHELKPAQPTR